MSPIWTLLYLHHTCLCSLSTCHTLCSISASCLLQWFLALHGVFLCNFLFLFSFCAPIYCFCLANVSAKCSCYCIYIDTIIISFLDHARHFLKLNFTKTYIYNCTDGVIKDLSIVKVYWNPFKVVMCFLVILFRLSNICSCNI